MLKSPTLCQIPKSLPSKIFPQTKVEIPNLGPNPLIWQHCIRILVENFLDSKSKTDNQLSSKEVICLKLIASGMKNEVVASRMNVAEGTVRSYLSNIFAKLNVENKLNAIRKGIQTGVITIADMNVG